MDAPPTNRRQFHHGGRCKHSWHKKDRPGTCTTRATIPWSHNMRRHHEQCGNRHMRVGPQRHKQPTPIHDVFPKTRMTQCIQCSCHLETSHPHMLFCSSIPHPRQANGAVAQREDSTSLEHGNQPTHRNRTHLATRQSIHV